MEYKIRPLGKVCAHTGAPLQPGTLCYSVLVERNGQQERLDFNVDHWQGPPAEALGYWRCLVPYPEVKQVHTVDVEVLLRMFEQLVEERHPAREKLLYVLTLVLLQRRRLKLEGSRSTDEGEFLELIGTRGEGPYEVRDQQLPVDEIQQLQAALTMELNTAGEAA